MSEIKVTGSPQTYGEGAVRNTKEGKGRFDLIPPEPFQLIIDRLTFLRDNHKSLNVANATIWNLAFSKANYVDAIIALTAREYVLKGEPHIATSSLMYPIDTAEEGLWQMMQDLAIHFEKGAKIYGEHNCEKGIPLWSFRDSGLRHTDQYFKNLEDEPHLISAIWNFWMLLWTVEQEKKEFEKFKENAYDYAIKDNKLPFDKMKF